ncbi:MAG: UDP-N-acetylmuramate dehydrogenase [Candidatus Omnitrophica bacterium]|nr:UDP-N-acetylmuramate dehydrogenase [Candidatus Omnitrophota bacterium]
MSWWKKLKGKVKLKEPLKKHTTFKIGGPARFFIEPRDAQDLRRALIFLKRYRIPVFVIGAGSNLLISDRGFNGAVLRLGAPYFKQIIFKGTDLKAGAGVNLNKMVAACTKRGLSGAEFLVGIPGTVGGSLAVNAGEAKEGRSIGNLLEKVTVMDYNGDLKEIDKKDIKFRYRSSSLSRYIILDARFKLGRKKREEIEKTVNKYVAYRRASQDYSGPSAGCIFKNPRQTSAGRLIDLCGLKGKRVAGAGISLKHANFIINNAGAKSGDVLKLMGMIKRKVKNKFNVDLKPEIKIWR